MIIIAVLALGVWSAQAQELKGVELGKPITVEGAKHHPDIGSHFFTTIGGVEGTIIARTLNDGRVYSIIFVPTDEDLNIQRVHSVDVETIVAGIENKFGIKLRKKSKDNYSDDYNYLTTKDGVQFFIKVDVNKFMDAPNNMSLMIVDLELEKIADVENKSRTNKDF